MAKKAKYYIYTLRNNDDVVFYGYSPSSDSLNSIVERHRMENKIFTSIAVDQEQYQDANQANLKISQLLEDYALNHNNAFPTYNKRTCYEPTKNDEWDRFKDFVLNTKDIDVLLEDYLNNQKKAYARHAFIQEEKCKRMLQDKAGMDGIFAAAKKYFMYLFRDHDMKRVSGDNSLFFSFRNASKYAFSDIKNETISLVHPSSFNDPFDPLLINWLKRSIAKQNKIIEECRDEIECRKEEINRDWLCLQQQVSDLFRMRCLVHLPQKLLDINANKMPVELIDPLMWAHYADGHKGFCVEYEIAPEKIMELNKNDDEEFVNLEEIEYSQDGNAKYSIKDSILHKNDVWAYEREVRLVCLNSNEKKQVKLLHNMRPRAIYLGVKCSSADEATMRQVLYNKPVALYKMMYDETDICKLKAVRIG